jgi:hypothetical protein
LNTSAKDRRTNLEEHTAVLAVLKSLSIESSRLPEKLGDIATSSVELKKRIATSESIKKLILE